MGKLVLLNRILLSGELSRKASIPLGRVYLYVEVEPPLMWEVQYSIQGQISPLYNWKNCSQEKNFWYLNKIPF